MLVRQANKLPTRKIMAVILSGMILGGLQALLKLFWPDHPFSPYMEGLDIWLQGFIMVMAGYLTKERAYVDPTKTVGMEELGTGSSSIVLPLPDGEKLGEGEQA